MRISDGSSDVCSSDLAVGALALHQRLGHAKLIDAVTQRGQVLLDREVDDALGFLFGKLDLQRQRRVRRRGELILGEVLADRSTRGVQMLAVGEIQLRGVLDLARSEEHTSELQSLMRISYAVFCLK